VAFLLGPEQVLSLRTDFKRRHGELGERGWGDVGRLDRPQAEGDQAGGATGDRPGGGLKDAVEPGNTEGFHRTEAGEQKSLGGNPHRGGNLADFSGFSLEVLLGAEPFQQSPQGLIQQGRFTFESKTLGQEDDQPVRSRLSGGRCGE